MLRALAAILVTTSFVSTASALDASCEWTYKGKIEKGVCQILESNSPRMGRETFTFMLGNTGKVFDMEENGRNQTVYIGDWKGSYMLYTEPKGDKIEYRYELSNGFSIKMVY